MSFDELIRGYSVPGFRFLQIGANDGITDDPIRSYILEMGWSGVLVEPLPDVFERLKVNYSGVGGLTFLNVAVVGQSGPVKMLRHPRLSQCSGMSKRTRLQRKAEMVEVEVEGVQMGDLVRRYYGVGNWGLLQIDVEGHDWEILGWLDLSGTAPVPRVIRYESKHLSSSEQGGCIEKLSLAGYSMFAEGPDTVAYL